MLPLHGAGNALPLLGATTKAHGLCFRAGAYTTAIKCRAYRARTVYRIAERVGRCRPRTSIQTTPDRYDSNRAGLATCRARIRACRSGNSTSLVRYAAKNTGRKSVSELLQPCCFDRPTAATEHDRN